MKWCETFVLYNFLETLINYKIYILKIIYR